MWNDLKQQKEAIVVVGLGYVGLPLAHAFAKEFNEEYGSHLQESIIRPGKSQPGIRLGAP